MMTGLIRPMATPAPVAVIRHRRARPGPWLTALGLALALTGCGARWPLPVMLFLGMGMSSDESLSPELLQDIRTGFDELERGYRKVNSSTRIRLNLYREDQIIGAIRERTWAGLAPDLLLVNADTAHNLLREGLIDPFPATRRQEESFDPDELRRLRARQGGLVGLPLFVQTQLACYNRDRITRAPETVNELLEVSAAGRPIGLPTKLFNIFWSAGSHGAIPGINRAGDGQEPSRAERAAITRWLAWLQNANEQQRVLFYDNQEAAESQLVKGNLDWIPCRSNRIPALAKAMGARFAVAPLPGGEAGEQPSPINRLRVLALGRNSSRAGRERALAFSRFAINPMTQRSLTLGSMTILPANQRVRVPVLSSAVLTAMVVANEQGRNTNEMLSALSSGDQRIPALQATLNQLVFGELSPPIASDKVITILRRRP
jgi:ABC-type glycerol-3-phosphate transport system substrate-binding protein